MLALDVKLEHLTIVPHLLAADFAFGNNFFRARVAESLHVLFDRRGVLLLQVLRKLLQLQDDQAAHGTGELVPAPEPVIKFIGQVFRNNFLFD